MEDYKELIKQKGLKIKWISERLNIPRSSLSCYLSGIRSMPAEVENKLKNLLK